LLKIMPNSVPLSVVVITFNEERNIGRCLASVRGIADEVVVVDSFSTDRTEEICRQYGATFLQHPFEGHIQQKNYALSRATHPYVLSLDADEALSPQLQVSVRDAKSRWDADAYEMARLTNYCGHWIKHTDWYPDRKTRLFDKRKARWGGANPHDRVELEPGATQLRIGGDLLHYSYHSVSQHIKQLNYFTDIGARVAFEKGKKASLPVVVLSPVFKFIKSYFIRLGFLDGYYGFVVCAISAFASFLKYVKLRQLRAPHEPTP
jgi:glycosyltransferase involved in cell wall biosynthesis